MISRMLFGTNPESPLAFRTFHHCFLSSSISKTSSFITESSLLFLATKSYLDLAYFLGCVLTGS